MITWARSPRAVRARALVEQLQARFRHQLDELSQEPSVRVEWLRDAGRHGGGVRYVAVETPTFQRLVINVSQVHYDDEPHRRLASASALSTTVHPQHPRAPSVHIHVSFTELRDGKGSWRVMADLNPSVPHAGDRDVFAGALRAAAASTDTAASAGAIGRMTGAWRYTVPSRERGAPCCL